MRKYILLLVSVTVFTLILMSIKSFSQSVCPVGGQSYCGCTAGESCGGGGSYCSLDNKTLFTFTQNDCICSCYPCTGATCPCPDTCECCCDNSGWTTTDCTTQCFGLHGGICKQSGDLSASCVEDTSNCLGHDCYSYNYIDVTCGENELEYHANAILIPFPLWGKNYRIWCPGVSGCNYNGISGLCEKGTLPNGLNFDSRHTVSAGAGTYTCRFEIDDGGGYCTVSTSGSCTVTTTTTTTTQQECNYCRVKNINCPSSVSRGESFTISYQFYGTGPSNYPYEYRSLWRNGTRIDCTHGDSGECTYHSSSFTTTAPSTPGAYKYRVSCYGSSSVSNSRCDDSDDSKTCYVTVTNQRPNQPSTPSGPIDGEINTEYSFSTSTTDPEGDQVRYGWDWDGDGVVDEWTGYYDSGTTITTSHTWSSVGTYNIKVKAEDLYGVQSDWSSVHQILIVYSLNNPPNKPINPSPSNGATGISTSPTLSVSVSDPDGDSMDVSFYDASDDSLIGTDSGVSSGSTASITWSDLSEGTTYSWY
ncbi:MAG: PKD domain-containing protein, partial [Candidatus Aenigmarchaeota archaeon]|nr:PKD domain-containing protein [Candidatus Aenigmarchaeota archaeon]